MDAQNERFEQRYNEITFEAYCKAAIDHAIRRGIQKKSAVRKWNGRWLR